MGIDTSIYSNQVQPKSFAESLSPWMQMASQKEQIETARAQRPGIEAEAKEKQRIAKRNQDVQDIAAKFRVQNPDGSISFDQKGAATALASAGYTDESVTLTKGYLDNEATQIKNEYDAGANPLLLAEKKKTLSNDYFDRLANTVSQYKGAKREEFILNSIEHAEKTYGVSRNDPRYSLILGGGEKAVANSKVSPYEQANQDLQARQVAVSEGQLAQGNRGQQFQFAGAGYTAEGQDPSSAISKQAREVARQAGLPVNENMSLFNMQQIPGFAEVLGQAQGAQIMPAGTRAAAVGQVSEINAIDQQYEAALNAIGEYKKAGGKEATKTVLGSFVGERWDKLVTQRPELASLATLVEVHNADPKNANDIIDPRTMTLGQIEAKLNAGRLKLGAQARGAAAVAKTARLPSNSAPASGGKGSSEQTPNMIHPKTGKRYFVPAEEMNQAKRVGLVPIGGR